MCVDKRNYGGGAYALVKRSVRELVCVENECSLGRHTTTKKLCHGNNYFFVDYHDDELKEGKVKYDGLYCAS